METMRELLEEVDSAEYYKCYDDDTCIYCGGKVVTLDTYTAHKEGRWGELVSEDHKSSCVIIRIREVLGDATIPA